MPAAAGNRSCCAQSPAACIAGLWTAPLPAQSSPASQKSGDGGLSGKKIALDLQLADLAVQIVNDLLRIPDRRRLVAARKQLARTLHQLLLPAADHRRMNPKLRRQLRQGLLSRKRRHRHLRLKFCAVLLPLYAHVSRPFGPVSLSLSRCPKIRSRRNSWRRGVVRVFVRGLERSVGERRERKQSEAD